MLNSSAIHGKSLKLGYFCGLGVPWRPHAENINIPIGILMVWRGPGPPRSRETAKILDFYQIS